SFPSLCFQVPPTPCISTLSLHDALPISGHAGGTRTCLLPGHRGSSRRSRTRRPGSARRSWLLLCPFRTRSRTRLDPASAWQWTRSEEHTSELQSRENLVCRLLLEKKKYK